MFVEVCTSTMAVGAHALAQRKALVCRLSSIEELAGMDVLCSDKTGTLTLNQLTIKRPIVRMIYGQQSILNFLFMKF